jgi:hypothetical protein
VCLSAEWQRSCTVYSFLCICYTVRWWININQRAQKWKGQRRYVLYSSSFLIIPVLWIRNDFFRIRLFRWFWNGLFKGILSEQLYFKFISDPQVLGSGMIFFGLGSSKKSWSDGIRIHNTASSDLRKVPGSNLHLDQQRQYTQGKMYQTKLKNTYFNCTRHSVQYTF